MPIYQVEKTIDRCVRSLFEQTYQDITYIFVDDGSKDKSVEILTNLIQQYPKREPSVIIIRHEKNRGLSAARNTAVNHCTTPFLMHVDSDDYLETDAVEKLIRCQQATGADIVTGQAMQHQMGQCSLMTRPQFENHRSFVEDMTQPSIHHTIWGRLIRTSLYKTHDITAKEGTDIGEDLQVMTQLAYFSTKAESIWDIIYHYDCRNPLSYMSQRYDIYRLNQDTASMEVVRDFFKDKDEHFLRMAEKHLSKYFSRQMSACVSRKDRKEYLAVQKKWYALHPSCRSVSLLQAIRNKNYWLSLLLHSVWKRRAIS